MHEWAHAVAGQIDWPALSALVGLVWLAQGLSLLDLTLGYVLKAIAFVLLVLCQGGSNDRDQAEPQSRCKHERKLSHFLCTLN